MTLFSHHIHKTGSLKPKQNRKTHTHQKKPKNKKNHKSVAPGYVFYSQHINTLETVNCNIFYQSNQCPHLPQAEESLTWIPKQESFHSYNLQINKYSQFVLIALEWSAVHLNTEVSLFLICGVTFWTLILRGNDHNKHCLQPCPSTFELRRYPSFPYTFFLPPLHHFCLITIFSHTLWKVMFCTSVLTNI